MPEKQLRPLKEVVGGRRGLRRASIVLELPGEFEGTADDLLRWEALGYVEGWEALKNYS
jgi:hypothetical protein